MIQIIVQKEIGESKTFYLNFKYSKNILHGWKKPGASIINH